MTPQGPGDGGVLRGVDRAAFAVALVDRLRTSGVTVPADAAATLSRALHLRPPRTRSRLYWVTRLALVDRHDNLAGFEAAFTEVFEHAALPVDPHARRTGPDDTARPGSEPAARRTADTRAAMGRSAAPVPWITRSAVARTADDARAGETRPIALAGLGDQRFADMDPDALWALGARLEQLAVRWPSRPSRRREPSTSGRVDLRRSITRSRHTGYELVRLVHSRPRRRRRRIVVVCDVSRSMRGYAEIYLHLMRAAVRAGEAEVFVFATAPTRLTVPLAHRSVERAVDEANAKVADRYGGTRIAGSLAEILGSHRGHLLRGAIVVIASDGWDSDAPADLARAMARIRRRAHRVVWLNPRAGRTGFAPDTGAMAAALPYCDALLPADTFDALRDVLDVVVAAR
ncbi:VWA domain-containing protein [Rhodococcus phenolicus]|uniref:VWA domain-containing protein n=1 Tax=Rhodococcus phenolicus TaxID=263849 RepID=UPI00082F2310|nr:VWA domain-containing protein [Rhodococcus phenolicus]